MNQEVPSAVARQRGFVVGPSFAGITVQFSCGSISWCLVPYLSVGVRDESMHWYRFAAITPHIHIPDFCPPQWGGMQGLFWRLYVELPLSWIVLNFGTGEASYGEIDLSFPYYVCFSPKLNGGTPPSELCFTSEL